MATNHNFRIKNGLEVGGTVIIGSDGVMTIPTNSGGTTQAGGTNNTRLATTAFVQQELTTLIGGAPSTLNDLNELAAAINDDANYNSTLTTALATKLPKSGGTMTGTLSSNSGISTTGKMAVANSGVHASFDFYNNGTTYLNGTVTLDADTNISSGVLKVGGTTVIDASRNLTNIGTISSGAMTVSDSILVSYSGNDGPGRDAGLKIQNDVSDWGIYIKKASAANYGLRIDSAGTNAISIYNAESGGGSTLKFQVNGSDGSISSGAITSSGTVTAPIINYTSSLQYNGTTLLDNNRNLTNIATISSGAITVPSVYLNSGTNTRLHQGQAYALRIQTPTCLLYTSDAADE